MDQRLIRQGAVSPIEKKSVLKDTNQRGNGDGMTSASLCASIRAKQTETEDAPVRMCNLSRSNFSKQCEKKERFSVG